VIRLVRGLKAHQPRPSLRDFDKVWARIFKL